MTVVSGQTKRFTAASPVTRYWLANCAGFSVAGGARGRVERVVADQLEVRHGRRVLRVPARAVLEIIPAERVLVVRCADRASARGAAAGRVAVTAGVLLLGLGTWIVHAGKAAVRLVRSLPWQQYGRSVRSVTTTLWQGLSTRSSRLLTTSSGRSSAKSSSERARTTSST